ncbi:unnamed protein product [Phytophthora fragariaefolia]|uniref:Unnamed protein product n=1 Tax=Phytophthora fragariaefolia TaxID=1490495 RepID=A0A9W6Y4P7_9STRA|nr:unnamed protein product [Phytophthora fragariaefolia]
MLDEIYPCMLDSEKDSIRWHLHQLLQWNWELGILITLHSIWRRRGDYRDGLEDTSTSFAAAVLHGRLRSACLTIRFLVPTDAAVPITEAAKVFYLALTQIPLEGVQVPRPTCSARHTLLFFDGGSRGNPGPDGVGSVIIQGAGGTLGPTILWIAGVSYASRTTNNTAEYHGLLNGLCYASHNRYYGLQVIGDSQVILNQMKDRKVPTARHLQGRYSQCRLLADRLRVISWTHHLRQYNKAADKLANIAMDTKKSIQVSTEDLSRLPHAWSQVIDSHQGDVEFWMENNPDAMAFHRAPSITGTL